MKIPYQNKMVEAVEVEPIASKEEWNEYQMVNGDVLFIKTVLVRALKATEEKPLMAHHCIASTHKY